MVVLCYLRHLVSSCAVIVLLSHLSIVRGCKFNLNKCSPVLAEVGRKYKSGYTLCSANGVYQFGISNDGSELVLCENNKDKIWSEPLNKVGVDKDAKKVFTHQENGHLVVIGRDKKGDKIKIYHVPVPARNQNTKFLVENKGIAKILSEDGSTLWQTNGGGGFGGGDSDGGEPRDCKFKNADCLGSSVGLSTLMESGDHICNNEYKFGINKKNDKLVLCNSDDEVVWSKEAPVSVLRLQGDGNLVLKSLKKKKNVMASMTVNQGVVGMKLTRSGNVNLVDEDGETLWSLEI